MKKKHTHTHRLFLKAKSYKLKAASGFTVVETLVAIAVLLLAITAPLTLAERSLASAEAARREVSAFYLAQEAMEFVRNFKDGNAIQTGGGSNWLQGLSDCFDEPEEGDNENAGCGIDITESGERQIEECSEAENDDCRLYQNIDEGDEELYGLFGMRRSSNDWRITDYTRRVFIGEIDDGKEARVTAIVSWSEGIDPKSVRVDSKIFNWYRREKLSS